MIHVSKKSAILYSILVIFCGLLITAGSYAYWSWTSNTNKNIVFNTAKELQEYIVYDTGDSHFFGYFTPSSVYTQGMHSTISLYKESLASNVDLVATIYMNVNAIGTNMLNSSALKWVLTQGTASNIGSTLAQGNFLGASVGSTLTLKTNIQVTLNQQFYTIWIWLDQNGNPSSSLSGETLDTSVWTEINQLDGIAD